MWFGWSLDATLKTSTGGEMGIEWSWDANQYTLMGVKWYTDVGYTSILGHGLVWDMTSMEVALQFDVGDAQL